jgi:phosphoribosyl-ATP pyrophosphohydrolase
MSEPSILHDISRVIAERKAHPSAERSYVASLLQKGLAKIAAKITEEASEVNEAAFEPGDEGREHHRDIPWSSVENELGKRFGTSGIDEKASRGTPKG